MAPFIQMLKLIIKTENVRGISQLDSAHHISLFASIDRFDLVSKSSFHSKMFSDPKHSFSVGEKNFFLIQSKVNIFHQIQPTCQILNMK